MTAFNPTKLLTVSAVAIAISALAACNRAETPMEAPATAPPVSAPAPEVPAPVAPAPSASTAPSTTVGEKIDDTVVTTKVKTALLADDTVKGTDIKVETVQGEVRLTGDVETQAQIDRAVEVAKGVEGAARVQNGMVLKK